MDRLYLVRPFGAKFVAGASAWLGAQGNGVQGLDVVHSKCTLAMRRKLTSLGAKEMAKSKGAGGFEFTPQNFSVSFDVYPLIAMVRENALRLAQNLSAHNEWTDIHMSDEEWQFTRRQPKQGQPGGAIKVTVEEQEVEIGHRFPTGGLERFEILVDQIIDAVEQVARPQILLGTVTSLEYLVEIGGDARESVLGGLKLLGESEESGKIEVFDRPCQFVALRLGFPPYQQTAPGAEARSRSGDEEDEDLTPSYAEGSEEQTLDDGPKKADWQATLTIQSLPDEPTQLSVEVDGRWMAPRRWKDDVPKVMGDRLRIVDEFLRTKISEFLKHFRSDRS
jgi:hypothetical protein